MGTIVLAVFVVFVAGVVLAPVARMVGGLLAVVAFFGLTQQRSWAATTFAVGLGLWLAGHWSFAIRHDTRCGSQFALFLFHKTPLRWTLPQHHAQRRRQREMAYR